MSKLRSWDAEAAAIALGEAREVYEHACFMRGEFASLEKKLLCMSEAAVYSMIACEWLLAAGRRIVDLETELTRLRMANPPRKRLQWFRRFW